MTCFWDKNAVRTPTAKINIIPGFDGYVVGNNRELKHILGEFGVEFTILADSSDFFDTPTDGTYRMFDGGTKLTDVADALTPRPPSACSSTARPRPSNMSRTRVRKSPRSTTPWAWRPPTSW